MMPTIFDRYLARHILQSTLLVMSVLVALFLFLSFVDVLGDVGKASFTLADALRYVALSLPEQLYQLLPMAALLGTTLGLAGLAAESELTAFRAAGVSPLRMVGAVLRIGVLFMVFAVLLGETVVPVTSQLAEQGRATALQLKIKQQKQSGLWLRDGGSFVQIGEVLPDLSLLRVNLYEFDAEQRLTQHTFAESAVYADKRWALRKVRQTVFEKERARSLRYADGTWTSSLTPEIFSLFAVGPNSLSLPQLYRYQQHLANNQQDNSPYLLAFWQKLSGPFSIMVMMALAVPFVFASSRAGGVGLRLLAGIGLGLAFFVVSRIVAYFGLLHGLPPVIGAWLPSLLFLGAAVLLLRRVG